MNQKLKGLLASALLLSATAFAAVDREEQSRTKAFVPDIEAYLRCPDNDFSRLKHCERGEDSNQKTETEVLQVARRVPPLVEIAPQIG